MSEIEKKRAEFVIMNMEKFDKRKDEERQVLDQRMLGGKQLVEEREANKALQYSKLHEQLQTMEMKITEVERDKMNSLQPTAEMTPSSSQMDGLRQKLMDVGLRLGYSADEVEPFISALHENAYDTIESMRNLTQESLELLGFPQRFAQELVIEGIRREAHMHVGKHSFGPGNAATRLLPAARKTKPLEAVLARPNLKLGNLETKSPRPGSTSEAAADLGYPTST